MQSERTQVQISLRAVVFITAATEIYSLGTAAHPYCSA